ncbi:MAG TPA: YicC/YloC family endoribonuclease [Desulfomonilaceae bacterium]|nr:YicC/YloC family endoribonuclease [Desulfomonilaceae bacterium]
MQVDRHVKSMTGFGRGRHATSDLEIITEIRAVNHRFLDINLRVPRMYTAFEPTIRKKISEVTHRGKFDVVITRNGGKGGLVQVILDETLAAGYYNCLLDMKQKFGLGGEVTLPDMLSLRDVIVPVEKEDALGQEWPAVETSVRNALDSLDKMRIAEGETLWRDIQRRLISIREMARSITPLVGQVTVAARERLAKRIQELTGGLQLDQDRLAQEVALIADRCDVTEELIRLDSHVEQFLNSGKEGSPLGRKLDFLLQELHREVNTLGSKSASTEIASHVVNMKTELEKIREQTQNIE